MSVERVGHGWRRRLVGERLSNLGWEVLGLDRAGSLLDQGQAKVNLVAALPSLHTAYAVLVLVFFWPAVKRLGRVLLTAYPLAMGFSLVYSGEHYVIDVVLGWVVVGIVAISVGRMTQTWQFRRRIESPSRATVDQPVVSAASGD